jgi:hypothetical protein
VLSSLSGGYKLRESRKVLSRGYDWENSVFEDPSTQWLKGVIYFSLGDYESRKYIFNPKFSSSFGQHSTPSPLEALQDYYQPQNSHRRRAFMFDFCLGPPACRLSGNPRASQVTIIVPQTAASEFPSLPYSILVVEFSRRITPQAVRVIGRMSRHLSVREYLFSPGTGAMFSTLRISVLRTVPYDLNSPLRDSKSELIYGRTARGSVFDNWPRRK